MPEIARVEVDGILLVTTREGRMTRCQSYRYGKPGCAVSIELGEGHEAPPDEQIEHAAPGRRNEGVERGPGTDRGAGAIDGRGEADRARQRRLQAARAFSAKRGCPPRSPLIHAAGPR